MDQTSTTSLLPPPPSPSVTTPPSGSISGSGSGSSSHSSISRGAMSEGTKHGLAIALGIVCAVFGLMIVWGACRFFNRFWWGGGSDSGERNGRRRRRRMFGGTRTDDEEAGGRDGQLPTINEKREDTAEGGPPMTMTTEAQRPQLPLPALSWNPRSWSRSRHMRHDSSTSTLPPYPGTPGALAAPSRLPSSSALASNTSSSPLNPNMSSSSSTPSPLPLPSSSSSSTSAAAATMPPPNPFFTPLPPPPPRKHGRSPRDSIISSLSSLSPSPPPHMNYLSVPGYTSHDQYISNQSTSTSTNTRAPNRVGRSPLSISSISSLEPELERERGPSSLNSHDRSNSSSEEDGDEADGEMSVEGNAGPRESRERERERGQRNNNSRRSSGAYSVSRLGTIVEGGK
ncbi:hypothetical protein CPC08DRAFT_768831 [Agrocybe pediades]|nr:hypothetical protein CPC08DRAFT_768831 [Agrocybe pediades]